MIPQTKDRRSDSMWTFGKKIAIGFTISFVLLLGIGITAYRATESLARTSRLVAHTHVVLEHLTNLLGHLKDAETGQRGFIITGDEAFLEPFRTGSNAVAGTVKALRALTADNRSQQDRIAEAEPLIAGKLAELRQSIQLRKTSGLEAATKLVQSGAGKKYMDDLRRVLTEMEQMERELLRQRSAEVDATSNKAQTTILLGTSFCLLFVLAVGIALTRSLATQIGSAVRHIQGSSTELQSAANQQVRGARESTTSMVEIATTINELLETSRQIAESAQRVVNVAEQTAGAARMGVGTVQKANESIVGIRQQVDLVVGHMLELGKKSQEIGTVLDIVSELAEQTNILAINATIEAAGAGETGNRFAVVADEIRKLADRVAGSTKEIRRLIDDVRGAVNITVIATETGSKTVDAGSRQFGEVTTSFKQISGLVSTTTDAAREIELSTKQQSTAVEQVNIAISNVSQASKESEASSSETLQTASQLASLSKDLLRMVQPQARA
jgi:methyl-accepting chemotaxis protein